MPVAGERPPAACSQSLADRARVGRVTRTSGARLLDAGPSIVWKGRRQWLQHRYQGDEHMQAMGLRAGPPGAAQSAALTRRSAGGSSPRWTMWLVAGWAVFGLAACHGDKKGPGDAAQAPPADTTPQDLSNVRTALAPAAPDTFTPPKPRDETPRPAYPPAPPALMQSVERERAFSQFCYEEFGQKVDPSLRGGVAVLVTIADNAVEDAKVANSRWSAKGPGDQVNQCLNDKARLAWKLGDATVKPGKYVVQLSFRAQ